VKRGMMGDDAKEICPEMESVFVKETRGKADLTKYRQASAEVFQVLTSMCQNVERASIDEAFLDLTGLVDKRISELSDESNYRNINKNTLLNTCAVWIDENSSDITLTGNFLEDLRSALGSDNESENVETEPNYDNVENKRNLEIADRQKNLIPFLEYVNNTHVLANAEYRLAIGAQIVEEIRRAVYEKTEFRCSAGIAHNKILAKLACGINKPNKQTILPHIAVRDYFATLPVHKLRYLGGKLGDVVQEELGCVNVGDLLKYNETLLTSKFGERNGMFLYNICRGINYEPVKPRTTVKSIGCSKNFLGKESIWTSREVNHWTLQLCLELEERLTEDMDLNQRVFKLLSVNYSVKGRGQISKRCPIINYDANSMQTEVMKVIIASLPFKLSNPSDRFPDPVINLGTYASKAEAVSSANSSITKFFSIASDKTQITFTKISQNQSGKEKRSLKAAKSKKSALDIFLESKKVRQMSRDNKGITETEDNNKIYEKATQATRMGALSTHGQVTFCEPNETRFDEHDRHNDQLSLHCDIFDYEVDDNANCMDQESDILVPESPPETIRSFSYPLTNESPSNAGNKPGDCMFDNSITSTPVFSSTITIAKDFASSSKRARKSAELLAERRGLEGNELERDSSLSCDLFMDSETSCDSSICEKSPPVVFSTRSEKTLTRSAPCGSLHETTFNMHQKKHDNLKPEQSSELNAKSSKTPKKSGQKRKLPLDTSKSETNLIKSLKQKPLGFGKPSESKRMKGRSMATMTQNKQNATSVKQVKQNLSQLHLKRCEVRQSRSIESMFAKIVSQTSIPDDIFSVDETNCDVMKCSLCPEKVSMFDLLTHRDFHIAQNLQKQFGHSAGSI